MKDFLRRSVLTLCALAPWSSAWGADSAPLFSARLDVLERASITIEKAQPQSEEEAAISILVASDTNATANLKSRLSPGEYAEYQVSVYPYLREVDFGLQCSDLKLKFSEARIVWAWPKAGADQIFVDFGENKVVVVGSCSTGGTCVEESDLQAVQRAVTDLQQVTNDVYGEGTGACIVDDPELLDDMSSQPVSDESPPALDGATCQQALAKACLQPTLWNTLVSLEIADTGVKASTGSFFGKQRRKLSRALDQRNSQVLTSAVRAVKVALRDYATQSSLTQREIQRIKTLLGNKKRGKETRVRLAIQRLQRAERTAE